MDDGILNWILDLDEIWDWCACSMDKNEIFKMILEWLSHSFKSGGIDGSRSTWISEDIAGSIAFYTS